MPVSQHETDNALKAYQEKVAAEMAAKQQEREANEAKRLAAIEAEKNDNSAGDDEAAKAAEAAKAKEEADKAAEEQRLKEQGEGKKEINYDEIDLDIVLEKKTQGKYKKFQEIEEKLNKEQKEPEYTNEFIEKYKEAVKKGVPHDVFIKTQTTDFTKLSEIEKVKHGMKLENPDLSDEEINILAEDSYKIDEDEYDEKTVKLAKVKLKTDAIRYEKNLVAWQIKQLEAPVDPKAAEAEKARAAQSQKEQEFKERWDRETTEAIGKFKELKVKIGDGEQDVFSYLPEKAEMDFVAEVVKSPEKLWSLFRNQDGTTNIPKLIEGIALLKSSGNMTPKMAAAMKANAIEEYIKEKKNVDFTGGNKNQKQTNSGNDSIKELARQLL